MTGGRTAVCWRQTISPQHKSVSTTIEGNVKTPKTTLSPKTRLAAGDRTHRRAGHANLRLYSVLSGGPTALVRALSEPPDALMEKESL